MHDLIPSCREKNKNDYCSFIVDDKQLCHDRCDVKIVPLFKRVNDVLRSNLEARYTNVSIYVAKGSIHIP